MESEKGRGAQFIVEIPRAVRTKSAAPKPQVTHDREPHLRMVGKG